MNTKLFSALTVSALFLSATTPQKRNPIPAGTYGVCDCNGVKSINNISVQITFHENNTFHYINNTVSNRKLDIKGSWENHGGRIKLTGYESDKSIHDTWVLDKNGVCIKSRNKLYFMRLCKVNGCDPN
ncbi:MAG: hypothetical protein KG003_04035 [Bacteroidetes bacterium]|nr:hypothetical protein [Bacteroidota bacterium]